MRIRAGYDIAYDLPRPTPMVLLLNVRPERQGDVETYDTIYTEPNLGVHPYVDAFGNRCTRIMAPAGLLRLYADFVVRDATTESTVWWENNGAITPQAFDLLMADMLELIKKNPAHADAPSWAQELRTLVNQSAPIPVSSEADKPAAK